MKHCLYKITNTNNGKSYIGQTSRPLYRRWTEHRCELSRGEHANRHLQSAWNKYGKNSFKIKEISVHGSLEELNKAEIAAIASESNLYNLASGGKSHVHPQSAIEAISRFHSIPVVGMSVKTNEVKFYKSAVESEKDGFVSSCVRKAALGKFSSRNESKVMTHKGFVWAEDCFHVMEILNKKKLEAPRAKVRRERAIVGMNVLTKEIKQFISYAEAGKNGFGCTTVQRACLNKIRMHKGYVWTYASNDSINILEKKAESIFSNPPRGPKSWQ